MIELFKKSFCVLLLFYGAVAFSQSRVSLESTNSIQRMASEATIWGMPIVAMDAMRQAYLRDAKAHYHDVVLLSKGWQNQVTTPNSSSNYLYFNFNLTKEPVVVEIPPAVGGGVFGSLNNAWQVPLADFGPGGQDNGKGGKYLLIPPRYRGKIPTGYIQVKSDTNNGYSVLRAIPLSHSEEDNKKVWDLAYKTKIYLLSQAANPPKTRFIDMRSTAFNGIAKMDLTFYDSLSRMINEEPVLDQDKTMMLKLKSIGLEKGKPFVVGKNKIFLTRAISESHQFFQDQIVNTIEPWSPGSNWGLTAFTAVGAKTGFSFKTSKGLDIRSRGSTFYMACAPARTMGSATLYLVGAKDSQGRPFNGEDTYKLHIPSHVPAAQFWSVNVYDLDTAGFIRESPQVGVDSYGQKMNKNPDGSVDIYFSPKAPPGLENNWVYTKAGKAWFTLFRFYGPQKPILEKTWILPNIEKIPAVRQAQTE